MSFENIMSELSGKEVFFIRPGGNHGDFLIYKGAEKVAKKQDVKFISLSYADFMEKNFPKGSIFYIHGGGGYNEWSSGKPFEILKKAVEVEDAIVIQGSQTVGLDLSFLKLKLDSSLSQIKAVKITFVAREHLSFNALKEVLPSSVNLTMDKDTALYLNRADMINEYGDLEQNYELRIVRKDPEASFKSYADFYSSAVIDPAYFCKSFEHWVRVHLAAKTIISNRTHSAVLGAIIGTPTRIAGGSYHKNKSIWEYSLKEIGVKWIDDKEFQELLSSEESAFNLVPNFIKKSWKVNDFWNCTYLKVPRD
jgi:exopolysaccharide biosynthesis predicted pyruvyltransferase EpsI